MVKHQATKISANKFRTCVVHCCAINFSLLAGWNYQNWVSTGRWTSTNLTPLKLKMNTQDISKSWFQSSLSAIHDVLIHVKCENFLNAQIFGATLKHEFRDAENLSFRSDDDQAAHARCASSRWDSKWITTDSNHLGNVWKSYTPNF